MATELMAVNRLIETLGEDLLTTLDDFHPLVPSARAALASRSRLIQARGWWFNKEKLTLTPDVLTSFVNIPNDIEEIQLKDRRLNYTVRGSRLYDLDNATYELPSAVEGTAVRILPINELPASAAEVVMADACVFFHSNNDGDPSKLRNLQLLETASWAAFMAAHVRASQPNVLYDGSAGRKLMRVRGDRLIIN